VSIEEVMDMDMEMDMDMDMDPDSDLGSDAENDKMVDGKGAAGKLSDMPPPTHSSWTIHDVYNMDLESFHSRLTTVPSDPRRRAPPDS